MLIKKKINFKYHLLILVMIIFPAKKMIASVENIPCLAMENAIKGCFPRKQIPQFSQPIDTPVSCPINARIIKDFIIDSHKNENHIIKINLLGSRNRYQGDGVASYNKATPTFFCQSHGNLGYRDNDLTLSYWGIGLTSSGIQVIKYLSEREAGKHTRGILLVKILQEKSNYYDGRKGQFMKNTPRTVIKKLGQFSLGPCWNGGLSLKKNNLTYETYVGHPPQAPNIQCGQQSKHTIKLLIQ